jgi:hypothetical protein
LNLPPCRKTAQAMRASLFRQHDHNGVFMDPRNESAQPNRRAALAPSQTSTACAPGAPDNIILLPVNGGDKMCQKAA